MQYRISTLVPPTLLLRNCKRLTEVSVHFCILGASQFLAILFIPPNYPVFEIL